MQKKNEILKIVFYDVSYNFCKDTKKHKLYWDDTDMIFNKRASGWSGLQISHGEAGSFITSYWIQWYSTKPYFLIYLLDYFYDVNAKPKWTEARSWTSVASWFWDLWMEMSYGWRWHLWGRFHLFYVTRTTIFSCIMLFSWIYSQRHSTALFHDFVLFVLSLINEYDIMTPDDEIPVTSRSIFR